MKFGSVIQKARDLKKLSDGANSVEALKNQNELIDHVNFLGKNLSFSANFNGQIIEVKFAASEEKEIPHSLGVLPKYRIILRQEGNGVISDIPSAWNRYSIKLKNNGSNTVTISVMIVRE